MTRVARLPLVLLLALTACGEQSLRPSTAPAEQLAATGEFSVALAYYRAELAKNPDSAEMRRGYYAAAEQAMEYYVTEARRQIDQEDFAAADARLAQGLLLLPESTLLRDERDRVKDISRSRKLYHSAAASARLGRVERAMREVEQALSLDPNHAASIALLERLYEAEAERNSIDPIRLRTGAPVTLSFREAGFKEAVLSLGQAYGVNMVFDAGVQNGPVTLFAENVTFVQAFELLLKTNRAFYRRLGKNSVVIAPDNAEARAQYEDYMVRTFYLQSGDPLQIAELLTRSLGTQAVTVNEDAKTVTIRDSRERVALAGQLVDANDRAPAEVVLEVEVMEVNRTKSEQLGIDFGSQITITPPELTVSDFNSPSDVGNAINASALSLPAATLRYFKQDVDARILASPRIRTLDKQEAVIHIGDQVPLRSTTIQDATGQTRTAFEYRDIGIRLVAVPEVKLDRSVIVNVTLEVSALGPNLGTADEPAFSIGTRFIETRMVLDDTETAIIGGLIRDEERDTVQKVPGLGNIPAVGNLFRSRDGSGQRTDIILTLRPMIIRGKDVPGPDLSEIFSGSGARVTTEKNLDFLASSSSTLPTIRLDLSGAPDIEAAAGRPPPVTLSPAPLNGDDAAANNSGPTLAFTRSVYETRVNDTLDVTITGSGFSQEANGTLVIRYRPDLVEATGVRTAGDLPARIDNSRGEIEIDIDNRIAGGQTRDIGTLSFRAVEQGLSYLLFSNNFGDGPAVNIPDNVELRSSRITIR